MVQRDRGAITCHGIDTVARCPEGKIPHLDARNRETWALFNEMLLGLLRPGGGYDYGAVRDVLDIHQVSAEAQRHLFPTLVNIIEVFEAARRTRGAT